MHACCCFTQIAVQEQNSAHMRTLHVCILAQQPQEPTQCTCGLCCNAAGGRCPGCDAQTPGSSSSCCVRWLGHQRAQRPRLAAQPHRELFTKSIRHWCPVRSDACTKRREDAAPKFLFVQLSGSTGARSIACANLIKCNKKMQSAALAAIRSRHVILRRDDA